MLKISKINLQNVIADLKSPQKIPQCCAVSLKLVIKQKRSSKASLHLKEKSLKLWQNSAPAWEMNKILPVLLDKPKAMLNEMGALTIAIELKTNDLNCVLR